MGTSIAALVAQLVEAGQNAVYTAALVRQDGKLVDWPAHEERLIKGAKDLHSANPSTYCTVAASANVEAELRRALRRRVRREAAAYVEQAESSQQGLPGMLYVMMRDCLPPGTGTAAGDGSLLSNSPPTPQQPGAVPVQLDVLMAPVPPLVGLTPRGHATALVAGRPRELAHVKHAAWIAQRKGLEQLKGGAGVSEVLLLDETRTRLLEGLVSNFAVLTVQREQGASDPGPVDAADLPPGAVTLHLACDSVLHGLAMQRALQAAQSLGWRVRREAPCLAERHTWQAAFICNSLRGIVPLEWIELKEDGAPGEGWHLVLPEAGGHLVQQLVAAAGVLEDAAAWTLGEDDPSWS